MKRRNPGAWPRCASPARSGEPEIFTAVPLLRHRLSPPFAAVLLSQHRLSPLFCCCGTAFRRCSAVAITALHRRSPRFCCRGRRAGPVANRRASSFSRLYLSPILQRIRLGVFSSEFFNISGSGKSRVKQQLGAPAVWNVSVVARVARSISAYFSRLAALSWSERSAVVQQVGVQQVDWRGERQGSHDTRWVGGQMQRSGRGTGEAL